MVVRPHSRHAPVRGLTMVAAGALLAVSLVVGVVPVSAQEAPAPGLPTGGPAEGGTEAGIAPGDPPADGSGAAPAAPPAAPALDAAAILELAEARRAAAVAVATAAADAANTVAFAAVVSATEQRDAVEALRTTVDGEVEAATAARRAARAEAERVRGRLTAAASESFQLGMTTSDATATPVWELFAGADRFRDHSDSTTWGGAAIAAVTRQLEEARAALDESIEALELAKERRDDWEASLAAAEASLAAAVVRAEEVAASGAQRVAEASTVLDLPLPGGGPTLPGNGPTVMGDTVIAAADLAAFVRERGRPHPMVDVEELARLFVEEGAAENIRADIAFAQSILETGFFSFRNSMVAATAHNYGGIGACDSCRTGFRYDSPRLGVRAQMQLLRTYADPTVTSADLAHPVVRTVPERHWIRGCCGTWMELTRRWATDTTYGVKILNLYNQMLQFAAARAAERDALAALAATAAPAAPVPAEVPAGS